MGSRTRSRRAQRSDIIDHVTQSVNEKFGTNPWTLPKLRQKDINITQGVVKFMHISGFITKKGRQSAYTVWSLTTKGQMRAMRV
jgi:hypothetical protein